MDNYDEPKVMNVGYGEDITIRKLAQLIKEIVGFKGKIVFDESKPNGVQQKLLDNTRITDLGWKAETSLEEGIKQTYNWYNREVK